MAKYDIQTFLLDRANIHDTITRLVCHLSPLVQHAYTPLSH